MGSEQRHSTSVEPLLTTEANAVIWLNMNIILSYFQVLYLLKYLPIYYYKPSL